MKTLITSHANADCDAFAAMLAARHLYPDAMLLFPGTQETGLNRLYNSLDKKEYGFTDCASVCWEEIDRLVIVDTRQKSRLPHVAPLLKRAEVDLIVYDHHPAAHDDLSTSKAHIFTSGAVTSSLCLELEQKGCQLAPGEATLLGLGIYGDTGSFTYSSTTESDFQAAAWLLGQGMNVSEISGMTSHDLTASHVHALNSLLESIHTYMINNTPVTLAEARLDHYLGDFAWLAHKLLEMENFPVLFTLGVMGDRIQIVARSSNPAVDVGAICSALGGGGHAYAASVSVRDMMITEVRDKILRSLDAQINPPKIAADYMSQPPIAVETRSTMREANELMLHFGLKAVPVLHKGTKTCAGLLDAQTAARATAHGLGHETVAEYMQRRISVLPPTAPLKDIAEIIVAGRQRLVPIVENSEVIGVVTRTDLINIFTDEGSALALLPKKRHKPRNVTHLIKERLPGETQRILRLAGEIGENLKLPVYAVGGFARDLLMNHSNQDIDLVAEGNGIALARALATELGGRVREHAKFLTSVVIYHDEAGDERHIDVATARLEYYEYPAALPTVELSSIKMDLFRRDFSINAIAIRLDGGNFGQLVDFFGGQKDINDKLIRVLHTLSFVEDPTRCIRAARFEQRYKFHIGPGTEKLIRNILPMKLLEKLSPQRLFNEFRLICEEENGAECLKRLDDLGILKALQPRLALNPAKHNLLKRVKKVLAWYRLLFFEEAAQGWIVYFLALCHNLNYAEASENYLALGLPESRKAEIMRQREKMRSLRTPLREWQKNHLSGKSRISQLYSLLEHVNLEFLLYLMASCDDPGLEKNISLFITQWRKERADITGYDIRKLGVPPGPVYAELLAIALAAKLDGKAPTAKNQLAIIRKKLRDSVS